MGGSTTELTFPARAGVRGAPRRARLVLLTLLLLAVLVCSALPATAAAGVDDNIAAILRQNGLSTSSTGVYVWDLDAARLIYEHNGTTKLAPASNMKLVTSAAALVEWGADHRFVTELYLPDTPVSSKGVLDGDVYLRGLGDPSLSTRSYQRDVFDLTTASFETFARALKKDGIKKIRGRVLGDAAWFDKLRTAPAWKSGLAVECGPLSALSGNQGLDNGNRVSAPATWAAKLMTEACTGAGIKVKGKPGTGKVPTSAHLLKAQYSAALPGVMRHMNQESDNFFAEMFCKGLGKDVYDEGSTKAGAQVSDDVLHSIGVKFGSYIIQDGSGLSYGDRLTALGLAQVLGAMRQRDDFDVYYDSLAVGGESGTLEDRMRGTAAAGNAHAKTGTLNIAENLSGYVDSANGHLVAYSMLMNGSTMGTSNWGKATSTQDEIVEALAKATLPGKTILAVTPVLRCFSVSAAEPVHGVGGRLKPGVQP